MPEDEITQTRFGPVVKHLLDDIFNTSISGLTEQEVLVAAVELAGGTERDITLFILDLDEEENNDEENDDDGEQ